jgi:hypothetical protein
MGIKQSNAQRTHASARLRIGPSRIYTEGINQILPHACARYRTLRAEYLHEPVHAISRRRVTALATGSLKARACLVPTLKPHPSKEGRRQHSDLPHNKSRRCAGSLQAVPFMAAGPITASLYPRYKLEARP